MGYHVVDPDEVELMRDSPSETYSISDAIGLENMGLRVYTVDPGEDIPYAGLHYHDEQEEVFFVVLGELRVETPEQMFQIPQGQFFVAEPESPHRAFNSADAEDSAQVIAVGAPSIRDGHRYEP